MKNNKELEFSKKLALEIEKAGGRAYYVGGFVRDKMLGVESKDIDIEVHGLEAQKLEIILDKLCEWKKVGNSFGVYIVKGYNIDITLPRNEKSTGDGHTDFNVIIDPYLGLEHSCMRRDFTINAIMEDIITEKVIDLFNCAIDLEKKVIRCVDRNTFSEDPLRVLRACQFASRLNFSISDETLNICRSIDITNLSSERIRAELEKALVCSRKPSLFFSSLRKMDKLSFWFRELQSLIGLYEQNDRIKDNWDYAMEILDNGAEYRDKVSNPLYFMTTLLVYSFKSDSFVSSFLNRVFNEKQMIKYYKDIGLNKETYKVIFLKKTRLYDYNKIFDKSINQVDLIYMLLTVYKVYNGICNIQTIKEKLFNKLDKYKEIMKHNFITSEDLLAIGFKEGPNFGLLASFCHNQRLKGVSKEEALKKVIEYAKSNSLYD